MDVAGVLRVQLKQSHDLMEGAIEGLSEEHLHYRQEGATVESIASIYAHALLGEDWIVQEFLQGSPCRFERDGWSERIGVTVETGARQPHDLSEQLKTGDLRALREFAQVVYASTDDYLGSLTATDLERIVTFGPLGAVPVSVVLANALAGHVAIHTGEVAALKGCLGGKGLPL